METALRNTLRLAITACRRLLEEDFRLQLEGRYGILSSSGFETPPPATLDAPGRLEHAQICAELKHKTARHISAEAAFLQFVRESAYTSLNRLAALKLLEHPSRALIPESVCKKEHSKGYRQFAMISPEAMRSASTERVDGGYRLYLELFFDDLANAVGVLFDRSRAQSILFPSTTCLSAVLDQLNQPDLQPAWGDDETIGWIYQYFTPPELRDEVRKASAAPRDSNELAFRNQFYTPDYVVAFLADNTLGRIWFEMTSGQTRLAETCTYLVHPPDAPIQPRPIRDPRSLRILDPACGSGHFLLYCFDLLQTIYQEAYQQPENFPGLSRDFPDADAFRLEIPRLILENNLHGIDIDLRATQIAALALWLRAQRAYSEMKISPRKRPRIRRSNIVCAEPMPGEYDLLGEFLRDLQPTILGYLVRQVWERMQHADEIGSLLKIEHYLRGDIHTARGILAQAPKPVQLTLFGQNQPPQTRVLQFEQLSDQDFWEQAGERVLEALQRYAEQAAGLDNLTRRPFSQDAVRGFAFVDLLQQPFDVVLMNPPFGAPSLGSREYIQQAYPRTKNDLYAAFVERGLDLLRPGGMLGAITSRTGFFLKSFQAWREEILLQEARVVALADLGYGVLDTAMVETAAYVLEKQL